uniref:Uncharacterized protein n=1 Tax=Cacopsylla melanoneura TaxID=428564 RepID=A0A8D9A6P0_9HEMI
MKRGMVHVRRRRRRRTKDGEKCEQAQKAETESKYRLEFSFPLIRRQLTHSQGQILHQWDHRFQPSFGHHTMAPHSRVGPVCVPLPRLWRCGGVSSPDGD